MPEPPIGAARIRPVMPTRIRILLAVLTVTALAIFVGAYRANNDPSANSSCAQPRAIDLLYPNCNTLAFQQAQVGVDMAPGYTADLTVNGEVIPDDQIEHRAAENAVDARVLPDLFLFTPGSGKVIERLKAETNCAKVTYHRVDANDGTATTFTWCWRAS